MVWLNFNIINGATHKHHIYADEMVSRWFLAGLMAVSVPVMAVTPADV